MMLSVPPAVSLVQPLNKLTCIEREREKKKQQLGFAVHAALCQLLLNQELTGEQHEQKTFSTNRERDVKACLQCTDLKVGCGATRLQAVGCERDAERCLVVRRIKFDVLAVSQVFFFCFVFFDASATSNNIFLNIVEL